MEYTIGIILFLMFSTGLFLTSRSMQKHYAMLSFIPILNWYVMVALAGYGTTLFSVICGLIALSIVFGPLTLIPLFILHTYLCFQIGVRTSGKLFPSILAGILPPIGMLWVGTDVSQRVRKEASKNKVQIKVIKCSNCSARQQIRVGREKHICTECKKVLIIKKNKGRAE